MIAILKLIYGYFKAVILKQKRSLSRIPADTTEETRELVDDTSNDYSEGIESQPVKSTNVPVWSAYNSMLNEPMPVARVGTPPHEWQTLLTVLMQAQNISVTVVGPTRKTVISLDMGLYQPAKKLQMAQQDLRNIILRPGELHIVMADLRTIGAFIDNSGLDMCWLESELYGPATVKQILEGGHIKRAQTAHMVTLQALFTLYQEALFQDNSDVHRSLEKLANQLNDACSNGSKELVKQAHGKLEEAVESLKIIEKMEEFDARQEKKPLFKVFRHYMRMVMEMMTFVRAVRTGDWPLHLEALQAFTDTPG